jgi:hypothetical protein
MACPLTSSADPGDIGSARFWRTRLARAPPCTYILELRSAPSRFERPLPAGRAEPSSVKISTARVQAAAKRGPDGGEAGGTRRGCAPRFAKAAAADACELLNGHT